MNATAVEKLFQKYHGASDKRITKLIHPTSNSMAAIDISGNTSSLVWSPFSHAVNKIVNKIQDAFTMYILMDMLYTISECVAGTALDPGHKFGGVAVERALLLEDKTAENVLVTLSRSFYFEEIGRTAAVARIEAVAHRVIKVVKLEMIFGVCPLTVGSDIPEVVCSKMTGGDSISYIIEAYLSSMERGAEKIILPNTETLLNDLVITKQRGPGGTLIHNATDFSSDKRYDLMTLTSEDSWNKVGPLCEMVPREMQFTHAHSKAREHIIEQLDKTHLVVSSELSDEVSKLVSKQVPEKSKDAAAAIDELLDILVDDAVDFKKVAETWGKDDKKAGPSGCGEVDVEGLLSEKSIKDMKEAQEYRAKLEAKLKKLIDDPDDTIEGDPVYDEATGVNYMTGGNFIPRPTGGGTAPLSALFPGSKNAESYNKFLGANVQDQLRDRMLKGLQAKIKLLRTKNALQGNEMTEMAEKSRIQDDMIRSLRGNQVILLKDKKSASKMEEALRSQLTSYAERMTKLKSMLESVTNMLNLSEHERKRLHGITAMLEEGDDSKGSDAEIQALVETITTVLGGGGATDPKVSGWDSERKHAEAKRDRSHLAYEQMLTRNCIRPTPIFPGVWDREGLLTL